MNINDIDSRKGCGPEVEGRSNREALVQGLSNMIKKSSKFSNRMIHKALVPNILYCIEPCLYKGKSDAQDFRFLNLFVQSGTKRLHYL